MGWDEAEATVAYGDTWDYCEQIKRRANDVCYSHFSRSYFMGNHYRAFVEEFTGDKAKALQIRNDLLAELPKENVCVLMYMQHWETRSTGGRQCGRGSCLLRKVSGDSSQSL
jgi:hypothetical protein